MKDNTSKKEPAWAKQLQDSLADLQDSLADLQDSLANRGIKINNIKEIVMKYYTSNQIKSLADRISKQLILSNYKYIVHIIHRDGTNSIFHNAYALLYEDWLMVFTEHNGIYLCHSEDLYRYQQLEGVQIDNAHNLLLKGILL